MSQNSLIPELQEYRRQIETIKQEAESLLNGLTEPQFNWRPGQGRWSIAECFEHLNMTARLYLPIIHNTINEARERGMMSRGPFKYGLLGNWFVRTIEPPPKLKFKALRRFIPPHDRPLLEVWPGFMVFQDRFIELIDRANGVDLVRVKIQIPATKLIKLSLGQGIGFVTAHERRHVWQATLVKNDPNFPT